MSASTPAVVPRWEWRTFADDLALVDPSNELSPSEVRESDEVYALPRAPASVKFRDDVVDVKVLEQVDEAGLEQWRPVLKAALPLFRRRCRRPARRAGRRTAAAARSSVVRPGGASRPAPGSVDIYVVDVHKTRRHFRGGGCRVELTTVRVGERADRDDRRRVGGPAQRRRPRRGASASRCGRT